jgi:peptidyl-prolyl cis-trans isomerase SurA
MHAKEPKKAKSAAPPVDALAPPQADAAEVADRQTQSAPLGLNGDTSKKNKKKKASTEGEKTRITERKKEPAAQQQTAPQYTPAPQVPGAPAPADHPAATQPQQ